jgi:hypothetical protein
VPSSSQRRLRLLRGGKPAGATRIPITVAPPDRPPFPLDALAVEDDTWLVLGADPDFREPAEHPLRVWHELHRFEPAEPGSVVVRRGCPTLLLAVVHDLSCDPTWREEWVVRALGGILGQVDRLGVRSLGLPILGAVHGKLRPERFMALLSEALADTPPSLERVWVARPDARPLP